MDLFLFTHTQTLTLGIRRKCDWDFLIQRLPTHVLCFSRRHDIAKCTFGKACHLIIKCWEMTRGANKVGKVFGHIFNNILTDTIYSYRLVFRVFLLFIRQYTGKMYSFWISAFIKYFMKREICNVSITKVKSGVKYTIMRVNNKRDNVYEKITRVE